MQGRTFLFLIAFVSGCADQKDKAQKESAPAEGENESGSEGEAGNEHTGGARRFTWGVVVPTMQLVHDAVDPAICPSGWTMLQSELAARGEGHLPPLQAAYVNRFGSLYEFMRASMAAGAALDTIIPVLRLATAWPCWTANERWRNEMGQTVQNLLDVGWQIEVTLLHHDSYPATIHSTGGFGLGGWSHDAAANAFAEYARSVATSMQRILPAGSRIYIANEPEALLFNGYLDQSGKWPPGGKNAGKSLAKAFLNMRTALREAARIVKEAGFEPAIAINVRPLLDSNGTPTERVLEHLHNWWLADALIKGCNDNDFSGSCDDTEPALLNTIGLTFYGNMRASGDTVALTDEIDMALPIIDVQPDADLFQRTLKDIYETYDGNVGVAEIGFTSARPRQMERWLREYLGAAELTLPSDMPSFIQLHTLFHAAEFSEGEWQFHLLDGCGDEELCEFTPWGMDVSEVILGGY